MSKNPINLALRFFLELGALAAYAAWGWNTGQGWLRFVLAIGVPVIMAACWGTFRIPNDPGPAPVAVPGWLRLGLELAFFTGACVALFQINAQPYATIFTVLFIGHYLSSFDRIIWMLKKAQVD
jgi:hypothetical protein